MSDIFEIVGQKAAVSYKGSEYEIVDPKHLEKIEWFKKTQESSENRDKLSPVEQALKDWELKKMYVKMYVPSMTDELLDNMGSSVFDSISDTLSQLSEKKFGAYVKKAEPEKKMLAAT